MYKRSSPSIVYDEDGPDGGSDAGSHTSGGSQNSGDGKRSSLQIDNLTVPVIKSYGSRDSSRNSSTERKPKDSISDQLKEALGGGVPKSASSTDLPTITGRKPLPRALQPKDPNARRPSYQPIIAGPFAFTSSTGLGATAGTAAGGRANLQNRRSSVSTCFPLRTGYRDPDVKTADVLATRCTDSIGNRTSMIDTRRGSEVLTAPLFGGGQKKSETTQDSIHSLLRDALGKKTPFMEEESSQNVVLRNAGRQSLAIRTTNRPNSTSENIAPINRHSKEDRLIFQRTPPKIEDFKSELLHAASKPDARVRDDEIVPAFTSTTSPTFESKPLKQVSPPEISSDVVQERGRLQIKSTSSLSGRLSKMSPMSLDSSSPSFRSVPNQQGDWYNAIPSSPRRSISISASPRMSVGSTSACPVTSEVCASGSFRAIDQTSTPYSDYLSQLSRTDDDDTFAPSSLPLQHHQPTTTSNSSDKEDEDDFLPPPPLPDSLPPLPDSLPPMLDHFGTISTEPSIDDAVLSTGQHNHRQTDSFSTEDGGLDRMDCTNPGYDELNERREARNCFSSREDLSSDGRDSLVGSPHPGEMVRGLASPTNSDADSGIGSAKYERRRNDGNRDFQQTDSTCNGEEKIMYRLLSEKNITKDVWSEISKTPDYGSK